MAKSAAAREVMTAADEEGGALPPELSDVSAPPAPQALQIPRGNGRAPVQAVPDFEIVTDEPQTPEAQQQAGLTTDNGQALAPDGQQAAPEPPEDGAPPPDDGQPQPQFGRKWSRRQSQKEGRERTLSENRALRAEVNELRARYVSLENQIQGFEPKISGVDQQLATARLGQIEAQLAEANRSFTEAEDKFFDAVQNQDKDAYRRFGAARDDAAFRRAQLLTAKDELSRAASTAPQVRPQAAAGGVPPFIPTQTQSAPQRALSPTAVQYSQEFMSDVPWLNQPGTEMDSRMLLSLDAGVAADGFDPATPDYWDELADRAERYLPHRFASPPQQPARAAPSKRPAAANAAPQAQQTQPLRRGPATAGPSGGPAPLAKNQVRLTPDRMSALEEAGIMQGGQIINKDKFNRVAASYAEIDRAAMATGR